MLLIFSSDLNKISKYYFKEKSVGLYSKLIRELKLKPKSLKFLIATHQFATHGKKFRGRPLTTLPVVLNKDLSRLQENTLQLTTREDLEHLRCIAQNRQQWRELSTRIRKAAEAPPSED